MKALFLVIFLFCQSGEDWLAPKLAKQTINPLLKFKDNAMMNEIGRKEYQSQCATCHGDNGLGDGEAGRFLKKRPADLTNKKFNNQTDGEIYWKITAGRNPMPAYGGVISGKKIWTIINYLRSKK